MTKKNFIDAAKITIGVILLSAGVAYASTWAGPTDSFPKGNVDAPINIGAIDQIKTGAIWSKASLGTDGGGFFGGNLIIGSTTKTATVQIVDGNQTAGDVLTSDANGKASWQPMTSPDSDNGCIMSATTSKAFTGYVPISMVKNGKNFCTDRDGCRYGLLRYSSDATNVPDDILYSTNQSFFQNPVNNSWADFGDSTQVGQSVQTGINGDSTSVVFRKLNTTTGSILYCALYDDSSAENSSSSLSLLDNNVNYGCAVEICDSGM